MGGKCCFFYESVVLARMRIIAFDEPFLFKSWNIISGVFSSSGVHHIQSFVHDLPEYTYITYWKAFVHAAMRFRTFPINLLITGQWMSCSLSILNPSPPIFHSRSTHPFPLSIMHIWMPCNSRVYRSEGKLPYNLLFVRSNR